MRIETKLAISMLLASMMILSASAYGAYSDLYAREAKKKHENDISKSRLSTYSDVMYLLLKRKKLFKPWLLLPNHSFCYQAPCRDADDCCRGYNICDESANVCIDCWYGYPCKTDADCCENYPSCTRDPDTPRGMGGRCNYY